MAILTLITSLTSLLLLRTIDLKGNNQTAIHTDVFSYSGSKNIFVPKEGNPVVFYDKSVDAAGKVTEISDNISSTTQILNTNVDYLKKVENAYEKAKTVPESTIHLKQNKVLKNSMADNNRRRNKVRILKKKKIELID